MTHTNCLLVDLTLTSLSDKNNPNQRPSCHRLSCHRPTKTTNLFTLNNENKCLVRIHQRFLRIWQTAYEQRQQKQLFSHQITTNITVYHDLKKNVLRAKCRWKLLSSKTILVSFVKLMRQRGVGTNVMTIFLRFFFLLKDNKIINWRREEHQSRRRQWIGFVMVLRHFPGVRTLLHEYVNIYISSLQ